jgi:hypothetical protein
MRGAIVLLLTAAFVLLLTGPASPASLDPTSVTAGQAGRCLPVRPALLAQLKASLTRKAKGKLGKTAAVRSRDDFSGAPLGFQKGVYFVSANLRGLGVATWAVSADAYRTGGGLIFGVGPTARRYSVLGADIPLSTLRAWGLTVTADGYAASRNCTKRR